MVFIFLEGSPYVKTGCFNPIEKIIIWFRCISNALIKKITIEQMNTLIEKY